MAVIRFMPSFSRFFADAAVPLNGFDPDGPWQMVPYKGSRLLHLDAVGVDKWSVKSQYPHIATISRIDTYIGADQTDELEQGQNNVYRVDGLHQGTTFLIARGPNHEQLGKIEIEVKHQRKLFIRFFLVTDNAGHHTNFSEKDTQEWTEFLNKSVFEPQVNVHFQYLSTQKITINENLKDRIDFASIGDMPYVKRNDEAGRIWHMITDFGMLDPHVFNVFCVWDMINFATVENAKNVAFVASKVHITADEMEKSGANYNMCMLSENVTGHAGYKQILAHEAGHYLNRLPFHTTGENQLMTPGTLGIALVKADARRMNPPD